MALCSGEHPRAHTACASFAWRADLVLLNKHSSLEVLPKYPSRYIRHMRLISILGIFAHSVHS